MDSKDQGLVSLHRRVASEIIRRTGWPATPGWSVGVRAIPLMDALSAELEAIQGWNG